MWKADIYIHSEVIQHPERTAFTCRRDLRYGSYVRSRQEQVELKNTAAPAMDVVGSPSNTKKVYVFFAANALLPS